ncbi:hypothetical protein IHE45_19G020600 [Dioscorea alata]|uniref:Uncharacterized protein n=2 Tax=Dioscorea alata TaxID=55571 RepID=A0ACB7TWX6_DIOAL|nr:hypothetical protein IHE45_19G020600 [Dioscorea alata]KAH7652488.1 hypothetical protein IHE45_19G020600 [Dioscorea alata]
MRRVLIGVAAKLRARKSGLGRLKREVSTCEYEDVRVMWEMLSGGQKRFAHHRPARVEGKRHVKSGILGWAPYHLCCGF